MCLTAVERHTDNYNIVNGAFFIFFGCSDYLGVDENSGDDRRALAVFALAHPNMRDVLVNARDRHVEARPEELYFKMMATFTLVALGYVQL